MIKEKISSLTRNPNSLVALLLIFFVGDAMVKSCYYAHCDFHNFSAITRGLFFALSLFVSLFYLTDFRKKTLLFISILALFFFLGQYAFSPKGFEDHLLDNLIYFSRYLFIFSILLFYNGLRTIPLRKKALNTFEWIIIINTAALFVGFLFDMKMLKTYQGTRFGFSGFFLVPSISTFFYAISLSYLAFKIKEAPKYKLLFIAVLLASFLVGTKALLLFAALTLAHLFFLYKIYLHKIFYGFLAAAILLFFIFKNKLISVLEKTFSVLVSVYEESGFITMATSYRNINLQSDLIEMVDANWGIINYLIGGTNFTRYRVEFDFIDVFLFFGIVGGVLYLIYYFKHIIKFFKLTRFGKIQVGFILCIGFLSGSFFNNAPIALYLCVLLFTIFKSDINEVH